ELDQPFKLITPLLSCFPPKPMLQLSYVHKQRTIVATMKSQDILLLLKLLSMEKSKAGGLEQDYSVRQLEGLTGISKSELSAALNRCIYAGLAVRDIESNKPRVNRKALLGFLLNGIKYV